MGDQFIEIDIEGEAKIQAAFLRAEQHFHDSAREHVSDLSQFTTAWLAATVPTYDKYIFRHISREVPMWRPGGAGGGGEWESVAGIKEGTSQHPLYVEFGTGIYGRRGKPYGARWDRAPASVIATGRRRLTKRRGGVMTFQKHGEPRKFVRWVRGQPGQHYFYETWRVLTIYSRTRVFTSSWFTKP